ncbi:DegV family protein [Frisingicoccus sp.]|uniref:DegV family protein n=1 Tax=Frisingicoccus sp. TaxID=1918627 RepID=UPI003AB5D851
MKTAVVTDTNSGITAELGKELGVYVVPMPVMIDGKTYYEGVNLTQEAFFQSLMSGGDITTSQPSPGDVMELWDSVLTEGYDELVYIPMSSGLSNSCASAIILAGDYEGRVQVADNHRISVTQYASILDALKLAKEGKNAFEIKKALEAAAYDASIYIAVDTLEFLKKGGRITPAAAAAGSVLNIKPILTIQGDRLDAFTKVRGTKRCRAKLIEALKNDFKERLAGEDMSKIRVGTAGSFRNVEDARAWRQEVADAFPGFEVIYGNLGCSIATHTGPEARGIGFYKVL